MEHTRRRNRWRKKGCPTRSDEEARRYAWRLNNHDDFRMGLYIVFCLCLWSKQTPHSARSSSTTDLEHVLKRSLRWKIHESVTEDIGNSRTEVEAEPALRDEAQRDISECQGEKETRDLVKGRQRSQSGAGATAFLRARPVDSAGTIPASKFVTATSIQI